MAISFAAEYRTGSYLIQYTSRRDHTERLPQYRQSLDKQRSRPIRLLGVSDCLKDLKLTELGLLLRGFMQLQPRQLRLSERAVQAFATHEVVLTFRVHGTSIQSVVRRAAGDQTLRSEGAGGGPAIDAQTMRHASLPNICDIAAAGISGRRERETHMQHVATGLPALHLSLTKPHAFTASLTSRAPANRLVHVTSVPTHSTPVHTERRAGHHRTHRSSHPQAPAWALPGVLTHASAGRRRSCCGRRSRTSWIARPRCPRRGPRCP